MRYLTMLPVFAVSLIAGCTQLQEPKSADEAFQRVCTAAFALEAVKEGEQVPAQVDRLCADKTLPSRILTLINALADEADKVSDSLKNQP